jgi:23S rRNA (guanine745-N1)-methyltransferase
VLRCPVCKEPLERTHRSWRCPGGHSYDVAKEGYVNLLITHQRRQREPGDSAEMLRHRRAFLDAGHYAPLKEAVGALVPTGAAQVLDVGCGEGYYTRDLPNRLCGIDIAKAAVRMAAKRRRDGATYAVASAYDLPVLDGAADVALSIFAPLHSPELERVVRPDGGRVITVVPGPRHLDGLKARFFDEPEVHPDEGPFERDGAQTALRRVADPVAVTYDLALDEPGAIADLVHMTPYAWYVSPERRQAAIEGGTLRTTVDFRIFSYGVS